MIICAAVKFQMVNENLGDENGFVVIPGHRHADCYHTIKDLGFNREDYTKHIEGFIDNNGDFWDREESLFKATQCGQLSSTVKQDKRTRNTYELFSEDLY